ncbi:MAG: toxin-antitoxin system HicB family antitoxin [Thermoleophilaceae bacterium]|nr:toxin-antitoxin system HicB family antitoxin [Thermoleophilaceae bacterium]
MSKMLQVRNVPDDVHRTLKIRAAEAGVSLSDYVLAEMVRLAERPTMEEMRERLTGKPPLHLGGAEIARIIREDRDARS